MSEINQSSVNERQRILRARAVALAREPEESGDEGNQVEVVEFLLADERYAIESTYIGEVYPLKDLTPLPCTPSFVLGIINIRGKILSVIDLRTFFDLAVKGLSDLNKVIVLQDAAIEFGILADSIVGARSISRSDLQMSLPTLTDIRAEYLLGITRDRLVVLDGGKILTNQRIIVHEDI